MDIKTLTNLPFYIKLACVLFSIFAIGYLVIIAKEILSPMVFSCLFSILLLPIAQFFEYKVHLPRSIAAMISVILMLMLIGVIIHVIGSQIADLAKEWPEFQAQIKKSFWEFCGWVADNFHITRGKQLRVVNSATSKVLSPDSAVIGATVLSVSGIILFLVFTFIYSFLFLLYRSLIMKFLESVFLKENNATVHEILEQIQYMIRKYIIGLLLQMAIVAAVVCLCFSLIGVKYAILLGLIVGLFNVVSYIGIFTGLVISVRRVNAPADIT